MRRELRAFVSPIVAACVVLSTLSLKQGMSQEQQEVVTNGPRVTFPEMSREFLDLFFDSLRAQTVFAPPPLQTSQRVDANTSGMWAGTKTIVETELREVVLRFKPTDEARLERAGGASEGRSLLAESVDITIKVEPRKMTIIHPLAEAQLARVGISAEYPEYSKSPARTEFVPGFRDAGMYFAAPALGPAEVEKAWGLLVCPRQLVINSAQRGVSGRVELRNSPYALAEMQMTWQGQVQASMSASTKRERLAMELHASAAMPSSSEYRDEVATLSPWLSLSYKPQSPFSFIRMPHEGSVQQGFLAVVEMQNAAGYQRRQFFSHVAYVKRIDEPSPVNVIVRANRVNRDEGVCYVVAAQRSVWSQFEKRAAAQ
jgi:hypothetical protein